MTLFSAQETSQQLHCIFFKYIIFHPVTHRVNLPQATFSTCLVTVQQGSKIISYVMFVQYLLSIKPQGVTTSCFCSSVILVVVNVCFTSAYCNTRAVGGASSVMWSLNSSTVASLLYTPLIPATSTQALHKPRPSVSPAGCSL